MCRVPAGALPAGTYTAPTWLDALAAGAVLPPAPAVSAPPAPASASASDAAAASASVVPQQLHVPLPAISDAELCMLDSLLNVKGEGESTQEQQQPQPQQQQPAAGTTKPPSAQTFVAHPPPAPPAFLSGVFASSGLAASFGVTHANAATFSAQALLESRGKRVKKSAEEIEAQIERVKKRRRESAQRSRARKSLFVKSLEVENRELRRELFRLRAVVEAALAGGHALHPSALVPPPSFAAAAGGAAAAGAAYFAAADDDADEEDELEESCRGNEKDECGASNAVALSSRSDGSEPISTDC